jgi:hypothetical protein
MCIGIFPENLNFLAPIPHTLVKPFRISGGSPLGAIGGLVVGVYSPFTITPVAKVRTHGRSITIGGDILHSVGHSLPPLVTKYAGGRFPSRGFTGAPCATADSSLFLADLGVSNMPQLCGFENGSSTRECEGAQARCAQPEADPVKGMWRRPGQSAQMRRCRTCGIEKTKAGRHHDSSRSGGDR